MLLRELMHAQWANVLEAYRTDIEGDLTREHLADFIQEYFADIAQAVTPPPRQECPIVGESAAMAQLRTRIDQLSRRSRAPVLLFGEAGTGRRYIAQALHLSTYPNGEWVELDETRRLEDLGKHLARLRKSGSAGTGEGMTVFVRELTRSSPAVQAQLVQLLEEQRLPLRVIAASCCSLAEPARDGRLRRDLLFGFSNELKLPPLAERKEDIAPLVRHFARLSAERRNVGCTHFAAGAIERLFDYPWPGNATELCDFVERVSAESGPGVVQGDDLPALGDRLSGEVFRLPAAGIDLAMLERQLLVQALLVAENNQTRAATLLGLTRDQIRYRMAKFDLPASGAREIVERAPGGRRG